MFNSLELMMSVTTFGKLSKGFFLIFVLFGWNDTSCKMHACVLKYVQNSSGFCTYTRYFRFWATWSWDACTIWLSLVTQKAAANHPIQNSKQTNNLLKLSCWGCQTWKSSWQTWKVRSLPQTASFNCSISPINLHRSATVKCCSIQNELMIPSKTSNGKTMVEWNYEKGLQKDCTETWLW